MYKLISTYTCCMWDVSYRVSTSYQL